MVATKIGMSSLKYTLRATEILPYFNGNNPLNTEYGNRAYSYGEISYIELATYQPLD